MRASWRLESGLSLLLDEEWTAATVRAMAATAAAPMRNMRLCSGVIDVAVNMVLWSLVNDDTW